MTKGFDGLVTYDEAQAMVSHSPEMEQALAKAAQLDFTMLTFKLMEEKGWTFEHCQEVQDLYRKFLALNVCYPDRKVCPTGPVDEFWHAHILDTRAYHADCQDVFGEFLHHDPSVVDDSQDAAMWELYRATFTPSAWGKPDPLLKNLMLDHGGLAALERKIAQDCETCA